MFNRVKNNPDNYWAARLNTEQTAKILGFAAHDISVLIARQRLKPLGKPVQSAVKYFAACEIMELCDDASWLNKATQDVYDYWKGKNSRKSANRPAQTASPEPASTSLTE
jgi:hypothetical protein